MAEGYLLSDRDLDVLKRVIARERNRVTRMPGGGDPAAGDSSTPEVYVALSGDDIPARSGLTPGVSPNVPVYRLATDETLEEMPYAIDKVYNLGQTHLGGTPVTVVKDKNGTWWAQTQPLATSPSGGQTDCERLMAGIMAGDCVTFHIGAGVGLCANVVARNIRGSYYPGEMIWVAGSTWVTHGGELATMIFYYQAVGLAGMAIQVGEDLYVGQNMGCITNRLAFGFDSRVFCNQDDTAVPCTDNFFYATVTCRACKIPSVICVAYTAPNDSSVAESGPAWARGFLSLNTDGFLEFVVGGTGIRPKWSCWQKPAIAGFPTTSVALSGHYDPEKGWVLGTEADVDYYGDGSLIYKPEVVEFVDEPFYLKIKHYDKTIDFMEIYGGHCGCMFTNTGDFNWMDLCPAGVPTSQLYSISGGTEFYAALTGDWVAYYDLQGGESGWWYDQEEFSGQLYYNTGTTQFLLKIWTDATGTWPGGVPVAVYEIDVADWSCCGTNIMTLQSGSNTQPGTAPPTITVTAQGACFPCGCAAVCTDNCDQYTAPSSMITTPGSGIRMGFLYDVGSGTWIGSHGYVDPLYATGIPGTAYTNWSGVLTRSGGKWSVTITGNGTTYDAEQAATNTICSETVALPRTTSTGTYAAASFTIGLGTCCHTGTGGLVALGCAGGGGLMALPPGSSAGRMAARLSRVPPDLLAAFPQELPAGRPGRELRLLLAEMGIKTDDACPCTSREQLMNLWGVTGCRDRREVIEGWLRQEASRLGWGAKIGGWLQAARTGLVINPLNPAGSILDEALRRAEEAGRGNP